MSTSFVEPALPARLAALTGYQCHRITLGKSNANVWRFDGSGETLFLKSERLHALAELPGEAARIAWLGKTAVPAPRLHEFFEADGHSWLLMSALPGTDLTHLTDRPDRLIEVLASGLRAIHALDPATCPFDHTLAPRLATGAANVEAGLVDESDFDTGHIGWTVPEVLDWLLANQPPGGDLVVTHGDASLPNIMAESDRFSGFIDLGRLGVADRWQDLAIACRSVTYNCGKSYIAPFLAAYGAEWDQQRHDYYNALDELF